MGGSEHGGEGRKDYIYFRIIILTLDFFHDLLHNLKQYVSEAVSASFFKCKPLG